jgi:hypothetical protein
MVLFFSEATHGHDSSKNIKSGFYFGQKIQSAKHNNNIKEFLF